MENKVLGTEWLDEQLQIMDSKSFNNLIQIEMGRDNYKQLIEEAKEMEKEQIINFANGWFRETLKSSKIVTIEQYYNETFKSE
jgi:hypothetical protein